MISCSADGTNKLWKTFGNHLELHKGKLLNTFSKKIEGQFFYDIPTCIVWIDDYVVSGFRKSL